MKHWQTKKGLVTCIYGHQRGNSKKRNHRMPEYTNKELKEWCFSQEKFHILYSEWKQSGFEKRLRPSIDRKNDYIHYCFTNIQIVTWKENNDKQYTDRISGKNNKISKSCEQYKGNVKVAEYYSTSEASRVTGINQGNIATCCRGKVKKAGGYQWRYKEGV